MTDAGRIDLSVRELRQLFHSMDPSPFYDRDLDDDAAEFIIDSARMKPGEVTLSLRILVEQPHEMEDAHVVVAQAVHAHFARLAEQRQLGLRRLFARGRASLAIGVLFLAVMLLLAKLSGRFNGPIAPLVRESFVIAGWVAMWRPLEIFLYDWWPIRADLKLYRRLATMRVEVARGDRR